MCQVGIWLRALFDSLGLVFSQLSRHILYRSGVELIEVPNRMVSIVRDLLLRIPYYL